MMSVRRVAGLGVVLATIVSGCGRSGSAPETLELVAATVSPSVLRLGDTTHILISLVNAGTRAVTFDEGACPPWFEVLKEATVVAPGDQACPAIARSRTLEP